MCKIITVHSAKGGVGKTSMALSISSILAEQGNKVLLIDTDPQGAASKHMTSDEVISFDYDETIRHVLIGTVDIRDAIRKPFENLDFIHSELKLLNIEKELADENNPLFILSDLLESIQDEYDYIILDTQPNTGLMTRSAMVVSDLILCPVLCENWPVISLDLTWECIEKIKHSQKYINHQIEKILLVPTFYEERRTVTEAFHFALQQGYEDHLSETVVHRSAEVSKVYSTPMSRLTNNMRAYREYSEVIRELLQEDRDGE